MATPGGQEALVRTVRLQSCDGKTFEVPIDVVRVSRTIDTMLKGAHLLIRYRRLLTLLLSSPDLGSEPEDVIPLPNVHSRVLKKVSHQMI